MPKTILDENGDPYKTTTAADGSFVFNCVAHEHVQVWTDEAPNQLDHEKVIPQEGWENVRIEVEAVEASCGNLVGKVTNALTGLPIAKARLTEAGGGQVYTDLNGCFTFTCLKPAGTDNNELTVKATGYKEGSVTVSVPATGNFDCQNLPPNPVDIKLKPTSIRSLFNTGVDASGTPLSDATIGDPHYKLVSVPGGTKDIRVRTSAGGYPIPPYIGNNSISAWIGPNNDALVSGPIGEYDYQTTFSLTGFDPATAQIDGKWSSDNNGVRIKLNGVDTGIAQTAFDQFASGFATFNITGGFKSGPNTLNFIVNNGSQEEGIPLAPTALRVEMTIIAVATGP